MILTNKISLQEKFNTIAGVQQNSLLRFNSSGQLEAVTESSSGILPQIKVYANASATVTCKNASNNNSVTAIHYPNSGNYWYFNVPGLATYNVVVNSSTTQVIVNEYKQYTVNAIS